MAFVNKKGKRQNEILPDQELLMIRDIVVVKFPVVANFRFVIHQAVTTNLRVFWSSMCSGVNYYILIYSPLGFCKRDVRSITMPLSVGTKVRAPFILNKNSKSREKCKNNNNKKTSLHLFVHLSTFLCESLKV